MIREQSSTATPPEAHEEALQPQSLVHMLRQRAEQSPQRAAFTFLADEGSESVITDGELHQRARTVARELQRLAEPGDRAILMYPPGLDFLEGFFGCLYAGMIAVPAYPPV